MRLTYAVHAYAWTSHWTNDDLPILDRARGLGLDAVEIPLMDIDDVDASALRRKADACGVGLLTSTACAAATDPTADDPAVRDAARDYLVRCVDATADMGAAIFTGVTYSEIGRRIDGKPTRTHLERSAEVLRDVARHAATRGVTVGIEPCNRYETFLVNTADQALELADLVGEPNVGVHLDSYHMNIEEDDFAAPIERVGDRLVHFHLSESHRGIPGRGTVDFERIVGALSDVGYTGVVGLESFEEVSPSMRAATCVWRAMAESSDVLVRDGLDYLKRLASAA